MRFHVSNSMGANERSCLLYEFTTSNNYDSGFSQSTFVYFVCRRFFINICHLYNHLNIYHSIAKFLTLFRFLYIDRVDNYSYPLKLFPYQSLDWLICF